MSDAIDFLNTVPDCGSLPDSYQGHRVEAVPCPVKRGEVHFHREWSTEAGVSDSLHDRGHPVRGEHVIKHLIEVASGEKMQREYFPQVYS